MSSKEPLNNDKDDNVPAPAPEDDEKKVSTDIYEEDTSTPTSDNIEPPTERAVQSEAPYSIFTTSQKKWIVFAAAIAGFFSPLSSSIYFPSISVIAKDFGVSTSKINLTVTLYLIMQGIASLLIASFSDNLGRRPAYMICFIIFIAANLGLALQNNFGALLGLRMLQSLGASGTISLAQGVTGDVVTSAERGKYVAFSSIGQILAPTVAPILGGVLSQYLGWHSIFWFLLIASALFVIGLALFLPETCRKVVGDGSLQRPLINVNVFDLVARRKRDESDQRGPRPFHGPYVLGDISPLAPLKALIDMESVLVLVASALALASIYAISTASSEIFGGLYGFDQLFVSLMFIPLGVGAIVSAYTTGLLIDWNYRRHARTSNMPLTRNRQQDLSNFNIERARLEVALPLMVMNAVSVIAFGWVTNQKVNLAGPVIILFISGYALSATFQTFNVLMIDIYPSKPATITAAGNLVRAELGAAATAAIAPMISAMGNGWAFTVLACISFLYCPLLFLVMVRGMSWRQKKLARAAERKEKG